MSQKLSLKEKAAAGLAEDFIDICDADMLYALADTYLGATMRDEFRHHVRAQVPERMAILNDLIKRAIDVKRMKD